jgi:hypothetical protein
LEGHPAFGVRDGEGALEPALKIWRIGMDSIELIFLSVVTCAVLSLLFLMFGLVRFMTDRRKLILLIAIGLYVGALIPMLGFHGEVFRRALISSLMLVVSFAGAIWSRSIAGRRIATADGLALLLVLPGLFLPIYTYTYTL